MPLRRRVPTLFSAPRMDWACLALSVLALLLTLTAVRTTPPGDMARQIGTARLVAGPANAP